MIIQPVHIINKLFVEVDCNSMEEALRLKQNLGQFVTKKLSPHLSKAFDELGTSNEFYTVDKVAVAFENDFFKESNLSEITNKIHTRTTETLSLNRNDLTINNQKFKDEKQRNYKAFIYFLENGRHPWFFAERETLNLEALTLFLKETQPHSLTECLSKTETQKRLAYQFAEHPKFMLTVWRTYAELKKLPKSSINGLVVLASKVVDKKILEEIGSSLFQYDRLSALERERRLIKLFEFYKSKSGLSLERFQSLSNFFNLKIGISFIPTVLIASFLNLEKATLVFQPSEKISFHKSKSLSTKEIEERLQSTPVKFQYKKPTLDSDDTFKEEHQPIEHNPVETDESQGLILPNCGLILLHPFLSILFEELGVLSSQKQIAEEHYDLVVQLLHFIATGEENISEQQLGAAKQLCGVFSSYPIKKENVLQEKHKKEALNLIQTVLNYWSALKNTTAVGLRGQFLIRSGKWVTTNEKIELFIERQTADILLDQLPWRLSMVKLPWLKKMIYVTW
ncbi:contractile injection system tape measure protein [Leeuwenhoekiella sp. ZYFB001]|uniref:contractile injection system tape measure protein n=1 Tax=Leeuwenhoekiella sp. ZYFB001 TaxID=2719912 RepID=UPI001431804C|nr:contractile injection system tape measure protein [Leeuwenhoekiella sp. ZYFB001]